SGELEKPLLALGIEETVKIELHPRLREGEPELPRRDLLQGVGLVKDEEVLREEEAAARLVRLLLPVEEGEEKRVVHHEEMRLGDALARLLIEAAARSGATLRCAGVALAAHLRPDPGRGGEVEVAEGAILRFPRPLPDQLQLLQLRPREHLPSPRHREHEAQGAWDGAA